MGLLLSYLVVHGVPAGIASIPGRFALGRKRWVLGWLLVAGAIAVSFPVAIIADRMHTRALTEAGHIAGDWPVMIARPFVYGVLYLLVTGIGYASLRLRTRH